MDTFKILAKQEFEMWNAFVNESNNGTVFHLTHLLEPISDYIHADFKILALLKNNDEIAAGFPFMVKRRFVNFNIIQFPPMVPYYGIVYKRKNKKYFSDNQKYEHRILNRFTEYLATNYDYIKLSFPPEISDVRPFIWKGFSTKVGYTFHCSLEDINQLYQGFDPDIRRRIKKAANSEFTFVNGINKEQIEYFFRLQELTFEKQNLQFALNEYQFTNFIEKLNSKNLVNIYTIVFNEKPVASSIVILHNKMAYYWMAGADPKFLSNGYNQLNIWKMLEDLNAKEFKSFDFVGASTPSVAEYKATYNFNLVPYYQVEKSFNKITEVLMSVKG